MKDISDVAYEYFKWLLTANADYIDASPEIREFVEKVIWQLDERMKYDEHGIALTTIAHPINGPELEGDINIDSLEIIEIGEDDE